MYINIYFHCLQYYLKRHLSAKWLFLIIIACFGFFWPFCIATEENLDLVSSLRSKHSFPLILLTSAASPCAYVVPQFEQTDIDLYMCSVWDQSFVSGPDRPDL